MPAKLGYLKIGRLRRVRPGTTIRFGPQLNTFVGPNGSGKTTVLALISALVRNNFAAFVHENFVIEFRLEDGEFTLEGTIRNAVSDGLGGSPIGLSLSCNLLHPGPSVHVESNASGTNYSYLGAEYAQANVIIGHDPQIAYAELIHAVRMGMPTSGPLSRLKALSDFGSYLLAASVQACSRMHEGVEMFSALFSRDVDLGGRAPALGLSIITIDAAPHVIGHHLPNEAVLERVGQLSLVPIDTLAFDRSTPPLTQFIELSQYTDARLILTLSLAQALANGKRLVYANPLARFTTASGNEVPHDHLSFGEKRLLTFLLKLYAYEHTIIVDELANGLHHSWLERAMELLEDKGTQAFLSSQNPLLLDCLPLSRDTHGSAHELIICELSETGEMCWRNLSPEEADDFFTALEVGLRHVSEIMRSKGLW